MILARLRKRYRRVSAERVVSGSGLAKSTRGWRRSRAARSSPGTTRRSGTAALTGEDSLAVAALDRFCLALGSCRRRHRACAWR